MPIAHTVTDAAERLGISREYVYTLLDKHDPETGGTVLVAYKPTDIVGLNVRLVTAESVERLLAKRSG